MKIVLMSLVLVNVLYFMWGRYAGESAESGVVIVNEAELGPMLEVSRSTIDDAVTRVPEDLDAGESINLSAIVGRSCVTIGPFQSNAEADAAMGDYVSQGMTASIRTTEGQLFVGHWVQIRNIPDREAGNAMLEQLRAGGLGDAYLVPTEDEGLKISLGLFGEMPRAERVELQAKSLDLPAEISPRMRDATVFFVDIGLPPGKGAGEMIEKYGEENVLLRDLANCPRPD
ncbi:MAG: SPOR domain-containing protein [Woeseiaceae bacterium]